MLDKTGSDRNERRSALVAHELLRLNIDIAALSEVRFPDKGSLNEHGAGYTLYWSGRQPEQRRISGVGIMIKDSIASKLETLSTGHSDRIMSMRLPLDKNQHLTLFSVYAPTLQAEPVEKDSFYSELGRLLTNTHAGDKVLILGDFNARVSLKKTEVLHQPAPHDMYIQPRISINNTGLKATQQFTYLGSIISYDAKIDKETDSLRLAALLAGCTKESGKTKT
ncbi:craniofacial development protein 2 [Elysia marginata]|uniref:Craniofacial development protein 2 n=1 Tax=Elysia marginata TaxID=1093978 RepID=A0AAV4J259_9GAST|nr:craniofacial development protein 2 [Elysia marginata]